jgi:hypothetical protein
VTKYQIINGNITQFKGFTLTMQILSAALEHNLADYFPSISVVRIDDQNNEIPVQIAKSTIIQNFIIYELDDIPGTYNIDITNDKLKVKELSLTFPLLISVNKQNL